MLIACTAHVCGPRQAIHRQNLENENAKLKERLKRGGGGAGSGRNGGKPGGTGGKPGAGDKRGRPGDKTVTFEKEATGKESLLATWEAFLVSQENK